MNILEAIRLLAPYHNATVICGQLTTGCPNYPTIDIVDGMVCADSVYDAIIEHESNVRTSDLTYFNHYQSFSEFDESGIYGESVPFLVG